MKINIKFLDGHAVEDEGECDRVFFGETRLFTPSGGVFLQDVKEVVIKIVHSATPEQQSR